jgi:adenylate cyclase
MSEAVVTQAVNRFTRAVTSPSDDEDQVMRKLVVALLAVIGVVASITWMTAYLLLGIPAAAAVTFALALLTGGRLTYLARTRDYHRFYNVDLFLVLILCFALQWILGGFHAAGAVMMWAVLTPVASLLVQGVRRSLVWFLGFVVLTGISGLIDSWMTQHAAHLPGHVVTVSFVMNFLGVSVAFYGVIFYFVVKLQAARARSEQLLLNTLPEPIARRLKSGETRFADRLDDVTVLFADLVDFTPMSATLPPDDVVDMLNELFSDFDRVAERHGLEKIRTIGDSYMLVSGAPIPRPDHVEAAAEMALDMLRITCTHSSALGPLNIRVGMHSGPVIAGVIGTQKLSYDVYGDTVNTASRMESHGLPGQIQVTEETYRRLQHQYDLEARGVVDVKGKGPMTTYWLKSPKPSAVRPQPVADDRCRVAGQPSPALQRARWRTAIAR